MFSPARLTDDPLGGHTHTERGYLPILATHLRRTLAEFANEAEVPVPSVPCAVRLNMTEVDRQALMDVDVFISAADRHPLERM